MLTLVYFEDCPNAPKMISQLLEIGMDFEMIDQNSLSPGHPLKKYSSPTLPRDNCVVVGAAMDGEGGCSFGIPSSAKDLAELLK